MLEGLVNLFRLEEEEDENFIGQNYRDDEDEVLTEEVVHPIKEVIKRGNRKEQYNIVIFKPKRLEEAKDIIDLLVEGNSVTIDLSLADEKIRQRILDMVVGYGYYAQCNMEQITSTIFIVSHSKISVN